MERPVLLYMACPLFRLPICGNKFIWRDLNCLPWIDCDIRSNLLETVGEVN